MKCRVFVCAVAALLVVVPCASGTVFLHEDFETSMTADWSAAGMINGVWGASLWHHEDYRSMSPTHSMAYNTGSPAPDFNVGYNWGVLMSPWVDLSSAADLQIEFYSWLDVEGMPTLGAGGRSGFASVVYGVSGDDTWYPLPLDPHSQPEEQWNYFHADVSGLLAGQVLPVKIGFLFDSLDAVDNTFEGWYVDDVRLYDSGCEPPIPEPSTWLLLSTGLLGVGAACRRRLRI